MKCYYLSNNTQIHPSQTLLKYKTIVSLALSSSLYLLMLYSTKASSAYILSPHEHANAAVPQSD